jgi:hypothetical protein
VSLPDGGFHQRRGRCAAGPGVSCIWEPKRIEDWLEEQG